MSRKRKTRRQKMLADLRHQMSLSSDIKPPIEPEAEAQVATSNRYQFTFTTATKDSPYQRVQTTVLPTYSYLSKDLLKTAIVTGSIIIIELGLAFGLKSL